MTHLSSNSTTRIRRARRRFAGNWNLRLRPLHLGGVVALLDRAKIKEGVLFLSLDCEPRRSSLLSAQSHFDFVIRADWDRGFDPLPPKDDIEHPVHVRLQFGTL
jgi:hypothetical protein